MKPYCRCQTDHTQGLALIISEAFTTDLAEAEALWSDQSWGCGGAVWHQVRTAAFEACRATCRAASAQMIGCDSAQLGSHVGVDVNRLYHPEAARAQHAADID